MVINKLTKNIIGKVFEVLTFQERKITANFVFSQEESKMDIIFTIKHHSEYFHIVLFFLIKGCLVIKEAI